MTGYNKLQTEIATGRLTLPVVILICLFLWGVSIHSWNELISFISCALTGYMMIEINTAFTLIRTPDDAARQPVWVYHIGMYVSSSIPYLQSRSTGIYHCSVPIISQLRIRTGIGEHLSFLFSLSDSVVWLFHNYCISPLCSISI